MTFDDFKTWFATFDASLAGKAPELPQWWELKARLDVVGTQPAAPTALSPPKAPAAPQADVEDLSPSELTVYEEAVNLLKRRRLA